jgi:hypothetical protein
MLTKSEAAAYCGLSLRRFETECPVRPIQFENRDLRYDIHDLDAWLDRLKAGHEDSYTESIVDRLP